MICNPQLALFIVIANGLIFLLSQIRPEFAGQLILNPIAISEGQWWRLFTFLFVPPQIGFFWMLFWLLLLYQLSLALESAWGEFRFFWFYIIGGIAMIVAALGFAHETLPNIPLNTTLFLAFATLFPNFELLLFFILPVKVKYLAALTWIALIWSFFAGDSVVRITILASLVNYVLFFGGSIARTLRLKWEVYRNRRRLGE
jgi:hypothetical protein